MKFQASNEIFTIISHKMGKKNAGLSPAAKDVKINKINVCRTKERRQQNGC